MKHRNPTELNCLHVSTSLAGGGWPTTLSAEVSDMQVRGVLNTIQRNQGFAIEASLSLVRVQLYARRSLDETMRHWLFLKL
jgi:hypothetical protein